MMINHSILTLIILTPLVGAAVLALLPDKGKTMQLGALFVSLLTFLFTLHLPFWFHNGAGPGGIE